MGVFQQEVGGFIGGILGERFAFEEFVSGFGLVRDIGNSAQEDFGLAQFSVFNFSGGGATDEGPIEHRFFAYLEVGAFTGGHGDFDFQEQVAMLEGMVGGGIVPGFGVQFGDGEFGRLLTALEQDFGIEGG